ncbi:MAG: DUF4286 family protein [Planctomycetia bacterium]|nr:DUF4286 family protein [Planctomycetia bacterium]
MSEIAYTVTATFPDREIADEWLRWLRGGHISEVMAGGATAADIVALDAPPLTYDVRYRFPSREAFERYEHDHAPRLRAEGLQLFPLERGIVYRRTVGTILDGFSGDA